MRATERWCYVLRVGSFRQAAWTTARELLYDKLVFGPGNRIARPAYDRLIALELAIARMRDGSITLPPVQGVTALIKTFERPRIVRRLVASIRRLHPELPIVVVDDSREPSAIEGTKLVAMPYDSGLSAGRNEGIKHVSTPFVLLLDDDFVFTRRTRIDAALEAFAHERIDIVGGRVVFLPLYLEQGKPEFRAHETIGRWRVCDNVPNFFVARTERLKLVPWDDRLKLVEHTDFFVRAEGVLTTVLEPRLVCLHARTLLDAQYMKKRMDVGRYIDLLEAKLAKRAQG